MESDLPLIAISEEDDSLIQQFPDLDQTSSESSINYSTFSPFALTPSHAKSVKDGVHLVKPVSSSSEAINNKENINSNSVEVPKLGMEPVQMKRRKKGGGYNLRKSLAWDRAFFTEEGILNPSELTLITGMDASACRGGLSTICEEGNSSVSSDARCTDESCDMEASADAPLKEIRDKNGTTKENIQKTGCSMRNHGSLLHHKVTNKVLSSNHTNRGRSKVGGCSEPLAASSLKRPANSNTLKTAKKESKLPKLPISKPGPGSYATTKGSMAASQLRHNLIPKQITNVEKNFVLKSSLKNEHGSQSKAKTGSGNLHLPVKELAQRTVKNLTHSSIAAPSTRSQLVRRVQVDRANSQPEMVQNTLQACKVLEESVPLAAKHLTQHAAANLNNSLSEADRLTSLGSYHIQRASKGLINSDRLHPCESQERSAALARPSGLRLPSPSLRLFDERTVLESGSLQQRKIQQYMGSDRKIGELLPPARPPMKINDITENICLAVRNSSEKCCAPSTQLSPSSNYMLNTSIKGDPDSNIHQNLITKAVPRVDIKMEYECMGPEQEKRIFGQEEIAAARNGDEGIKVSSSTEQVDGDVRTCRQLLSEGRDPETKYKSMLHNKEDGLQRYTAFSVSTLGQSTQHQEENISTGVDDFAQTSSKQADTEISDDAPPKVNPVFHLDAGSHVFMKSQEQDEVRKGDGVGTTKCVAPGIENYSVVLQHGPENDASKVVDGRSLHMEENPSPCSRALSITFGNSRSLEDVIELRGIDTFCIPFQHLNTEQRNDGLDAFPTATTTSPRVRDPSSEEGDNIHISPVPFIRSKAQLHDNPVRDTVTQLLDDNPSAEDFHIEPTTSIQKIYQLPITPLLHDNPLSTDGFHFMPTTSIKDKFQLQDSDVANRSPKYSEAKTPCISVSLNPQLSVSCRIPEERSCLEEGTFPNVTDTNDQLSQEKGVSSAIRIEAPGSKQDGVDVSLSPREVVSLIDGQYESSDLSHLRPQVEISSYTASLGDDTLVKRESGLQGTECTTTYPQSFEEERVNVAFGNSHSLEDAIELKGIDTFRIPFQNLNTEQRNDGLDAFPTAATTSPRVRDPSSEEGNNIHISPAPSIRSKAQLHDNPERDTVTQLLVDNPSVEDFHIEPTTSIQKKYQLPITPLLHDNPLSTDVFHFMPTTSIKNKSQVQDSDVANRSPKYFEATTPCISVSLNPRLSVSCRMPEERSCLEEGTFPNVTDTNDQLSQEKGVSSAIRIEAPGSKQDGVDVNLSPRELVSLIDDQYSSDLSHLRLQVEIINDTASLGDDTLVKRESVLQGAECTNTYPQSLEEERVDIAAQAVEAQFKIPKENHKSQKLGIIVAEKSQDSRGNILEAKPTVEGSTGGLETYNLFQSENQTLEGSGPISNISKTSVEDGLVQLLDSDVLVQSCSRLTSEVHIPSIEDADHRDVHGKQAGFSSFGIKLERASKSNEYLQQVSVCKANWNVVEGGDIYECDSRPSINAAFSVVEEAGNIDRQQCAGYRTPGSIVMESSEHNESYSDGQTAECDDLTLTLDSKLELEPSVEDKMFVKSSTCMEYCSAVKSCSFLSDSMLEEKPTPFLEDQVLTKDSLLSTEKILDSVIVSPEENTNASAQILPMVIVNGDDQPQGFVGTTSSVETYECDSTPSVYAALHAVEAGNIDMQRCVGYGTPGSIVMESSEHNESFSDGQSAECGDLTLTLDSELKLEPSVEDKMFVKNSTCMEYCSAVKSCSFLSDSMPEEKTTLFLEDQELTKDSLLSTEKILDSVIVSPEENTNANAQILPMVIVNGDDQPQGFVGTTSAVETCDYFTNGKSSSSLSVSQRLTTDVESTSAPELCCLVGFGDESLLTKTTHMIGSEESKISIVEQVVATPLGGEFQHESDDSKDHKVMADLIKRSNSIKRQDKSLAIHPPNAVPFSDEWLAAFEAAGEEILTMKCGAVQHSPQDKSLPEPSPWSPVKRKAIQIGPYDCTKYTNANSQLLDK